jgi:hypothetical protein
LIVVIAKGHAAPPTTTTTTTLPGPTTTTTPPSQIIGSTPNDSQLLAVFNDMTSGSLSEASQATWRQLSTRPLTNNVALYLGYHDLGYLLSSTLPRRVRSSVTSTLLVENSSHYVLARASITWVVANNQWRLLAWPNLITLP